MTKVNTCMPEIHSYITAKANTMNKKQREWFYEATCTLIIGLDDGRNNDYDHFIGIIDVIANRAIMINQ